jgi:hypothetical protein
VVFDALNAEAEKRARAAAAEAGDRVAPRGKLMPPNEAIRTVKLRRAAIRR